MNSSNLMKLLLLVTTLSVNAKQIDSAQSHADMLLQIKKSKQIKSGGMVVTVGDEINCSYSTIQKALDNVLEENIAEIRISNTGSPYNEQLIIDDFSVVIEGGYADCDSAAANNKTETHASIQSIGDKKNLLQITGAEDRDHVVVKDLTFNGLFNQSTNVYISEADVYLSMVGVRLINGHQSGILNEQLPGGMVVSGGDADVELIDVEVRQNKGEVNGGGISCFGTENSILITGNSVITNNQSVEGLGGGLYVTQGCTLSVFSPTQITYNLAESAGAGLFADKGARVFIYGTEYCNQQTCYGMKSEPVTIAHNGVTSDIGDPDFERGQGVHISDSGTFLSAVNAYIHSNMRSEDYDINALNLTGIAVVDFAVADFKGTKNNNCWSAGKCLQIVNNDRSNFYIGNSSIVYVDGAYIATNEESGRDLLDAIEISDAANVFISNSIIEHRNVGFGEVAGTIGLSNGVSVEISNTTIYSAANGNPISFAVIDSSYTESLLINNSLIYSESIYQTYRGSNNDETSLIIKCSIVPETLGFNEHGATLTRVVESTNNPFVDVINHDYHLRSDSLANDYCNSDAGEAYDLDGQLRGWDDPNQMNMFGPYDVGAYETYSSDIIFRNGFE